MEDEKKRREEVQTAGRKPCTRCLLREADEEAYQRQLKRYLDLMDPALKAGREVYESRLAVCKACDYLEAGSCRACGCFVELRAATKKGKCPYKKW